VRDFRGVSSKSFDGRGNYTLGMKDSADFSGDRLQKVDKTKGMNICITTTAKTDAEGIALLKNRWGCRPAGSLNSMATTARSQETKTGAGEKGQDAEVAVPPSQSLLRCGRPARLSAQV